MALPPPSITSTIPTTPQPFPKPNPNPRPVSAAGLLALFIADLPHKYSQSVNWKCL